MTTEITENELNRVRLRFIDLMKSFFIGEPDAERMSRWRGTFSALSGEQVQPEFDRAARELSRVLGERSLGQLQDEYYYLFIDPFTGTQLELTASYHLDGRNFSQSLVEIRSLMEKAALVRSESVGDPEDSLVVMLDIYASLIEAEKERGGEAVADAQSMLLTKFLLPVVRRLTTILEQNDRAYFYTRCCRLLEKYLDLEESLVPTGQFENHPC